MFFIRYSFVRKGLLRNAVFGVAFATREEAEDFASEGLKRILPYAVSPCVIHRD